MEKINMHNNQRTIKWQTNLTGIGLHTGNKTTISFKPAPPNTGIKFIRTDLHDSPEIPADIDHVVDISRGTTLGIGEVKVHTVEHVLAALAGLEIDNVYVELNGNEPPVGDGSILHFVETLLKCDFVDQGAPREYLVIEEPVSYKNDECGVEIVALPTDDFRITIMIDYNIPALGSQHTGLFSLEKEFVKEFAPARTFCFLTEVEELAKKGLIKGGSLENSIVIVDKELDEEKIRELKEMFNIKSDITIGDNGLLNGVELRFKNEFCRHKLIDCLGDLFLIGVPLRAQILAARTGHAANIEFVKKIRSLYKKKKLTRRFQTIPKLGVVFDSTAIEKILPHRYPFLMVDQIVEFEIEKRIVGTKNVTRNEPCFRGHFPGHPIMPGVLIVEAMGQVGGILLLNTVDNPQDKLVYFLGMDGVRFRKPVTPGDQLRFELILVKRRGTIFIMSGKTYVGDKVVCEAELMAKVVDR